MQHILGISAYFHDSAAALLRDGRIIAAAQEERFSRRKHDSRFPAAAVRYCLAAGRIELTGIDYVAYYEKPWLKFDRLLETYLAYAPAGFSSFARAMPLWLKEKLFLKLVLRRELAKIGSCDPQRVPPLLFAEHHQSHAASAFFASPFESAAVVCVDGVGEWTTTSTWHGHKNDVTPLWVLPFPHSLGMLYTAFTYYCGFKVNSGEYKLMGLAPYGRPRYVDTIVNELIDLKDDGTFHLDMRYFNFAHGLTMTSEAFHELFDGPPRTSTMPLETRHMDLARSIQSVTEAILMRLVDTVHRETGERRLVLAGGVALNCVANGRIKREGPYRDIWIQPAAGDAGGALGAALAAWHQHLGKPREIDPVQRDAMSGAFLGPQYDQAEIERVLIERGARFRCLPDEALFPTVAELLAAESVVGWFQGRMEFGPRALGNRSILGDPRSPKMQSMMNLKVKRRESFRPFAPAVLAADVSRYFEMDGPSPYMLLVASVSPNERRPVADAELEGLAKLKALRSTIPAVTHVDYSARIQTVHEDTNPRFHTLLEAFRSLTGYGILVNTSFNVRGEPIVCTVEDAHRCFMRTEIDYLVVGNYLLDKKEQPPVIDDARWPEEFELD